MVLSFRRFPGAKFTCSPQYESCLLFDGEGELVAIGRRIGQPGALAPLPLDAPFVSLAHNSQLASFSPPLIDLPRERDPEYAVGAQLGEVVQQRPVRFSRAFFDHVIRMDDKTRQAVLFSDEGDLPLPQINGVVVQDVKERVVLRCGQGELENPANEKW